MILSFWTHTGGPDKTAPEGASTAFAMLSVPFGRIILSLNHIVQNLG